MKRQEVGRLGERLAAKFLRRQGYHIIEANFRCRGGEIDIIAKQRDCLAFIEVRTRSSSSFGSPEESITQAKRSRLIFTALTYISSHSKLPEQWRIDVVAVEVDKQGQAKRIEIIENAVEGPS